MRCVGRISRETSTQRPQHADGFATQREGLRCAVHAPPRAVLSCASGFANSISIHCAKAATSISFVFVFCTHALPDTVTACVPAWPVCVHAVSGTWHVASSSTCQSVLWTGLRYFLTNLRDNNTIVSDLRAEDSHASHPTME